MDLEDFDPLYLVTLDEIFHAHWAARRHQQISQFADAIGQLWPNGHPSRLIQVTGTNGKGSVSFYLAQGLQAYGPTGSWTGPHVFDYAERFHINGEKANHRDLVEAYRQRVQPLQAKFTASTRSLSFAEVGILLALCLFEKYEARWGIMEVGNGGRYTPLMALPMAACVLTNVGDDHPKTLGYELWQRALEKAGIARPGIPFHTAAEGEALGYVVRAAEAEGAPVFQITSAERTAIASCFDEPLPDHVISNLALATQVIQKLYPEQQLRPLVARMKGRLTARFWRKEPQVIVDVAHNVHKIEKLAEELSLTFPGRKFHFILGLSRSRNPLEVFAPILPLAESLCITAASHAGQPPHEVAAALRPAYPEVRFEPSPTQAYHVARTALKPDELLVLTGSAYMIDQALNPNRFLRQTNDSYGRRYPSESST